MSAPASSAQIRIMMVDRDKFGREGFRLLILNKPRFKVIGEIDTAAEALLFAKKAQPHIILLELDLGDGKGLEVLPLLLEVSPRSRVLVLTHSCDGEAHRRAMLLGAMGVVQKDMGSEVLFKAIEKVHAGEIWYDRLKMGDVLRDILRSTKEPFSDPIAAKIATITRREREVIGFVSLGLKNKDIGDRLFISETTVRHHLTSVFEKLDVSNRLELLIFAFSEGLASLPATAAGSANGRGETTVNLLSLSTAM
jgi:two-component system nitrate/nitrite response regulator NarL